MQDQPLLQHAASKCLATGLLWLCGLQLKDVQELLSFFATLFSFLLGAWYVAQLAYNIMRRYQTTGSVFKRSDRADL